MVPVRFWTPELKNVNKLPKNKMSEARHGGGMCEFSLSYDGGESFHVIGTYTKTCPDGMLRFVFVCFLFCMLKQAMLFV